MTASDVRALLVDAVIDHVGIAVPDLDAAIDFHVRVLGGRLAHREENAEQGVVEAMIAFAAETLGGLDTVVNNSGVAIHRPALEVPDDLATALAEHADAARHWAAFPPSARRGILEWIAQARRPETRAARVATTVAEAAANRRANAYRQPKGAS